VLGITAPICAKAAQIGDPRNRTDTPFIGARDFKSRQPFFSALLFSSIYNHLHKLNAAK
jgi:hypothetical protein